MDDIDQAFHKVSRADFLPDDYYGPADLDAPIPIGFGQTNSQPTTVRMMLEWLDPQPGDKVLDVGSGSGWTTALLSRLVGPKGRIYAVEKVPELVWFGRENCRRAGIRNAKFFEAGKEFGLPEHAPYDRILVSASAGQIPQDLLAQLKVGGVLVVPVLESIYVIEKTGPQDYDSKEHPGFRFVPLV